MFTEILKPEIMRTLLPEGFPADKLSQPRYGMVVEKDVFVTMRDGARVAVDIFRPDAPGEFPALYATSAYQKDLAYLPQVPAFHFRETNDIEWFVSRGYVYVHRTSAAAASPWKASGSSSAARSRTTSTTRSSGSPGSPGAPASVGMIGESYLAWVQWFTAATQPPHLGCIAPFDGGADMYRDVAFHGGIMARGLPDGLVHGGDPRQLPSRPARAGPDNVGDWDLPWNVMQPPHLRRLLEAPLRRTSPRSRCPVFSIGILHKVGIHLRGNIRGYEEVDDAQEAAPLPRRFRGRRDGHLQLARDAAAALCAGTTTGSRATTPASWTRTR